MVNPGLRMGDVDLLVTEDAVHKGTSKHHKTDKKTHFLDLVPPSIFGFFIY